MHQIGIVRDEWLSGILGYGAYKVTGSGAYLRKALGSLIRKKVFLYAKVPADDPKRAWFFEGLGFSLVDTNIVFEKPVLPQAEAEKCQYFVRNAVPEDERGVARLARRAFSYSRFHLDSTFGKTVPGIIKSEWARNYFRGGRGDAMILATDGKKIIGFLQLIKSSSGIITIDLIAVDRRYRKRGIGAYMIRYAQRRFAGMKKILVGTQAANIPSMRLYESLGFRAAGVDYVFHYHNPKKR